MTRVTPPLSPSAGRTETAYPFISKQSPNPLYMQSRRRTLSLTKPACCCAVSLNLPSQLWASYLARVGVCEVERITRESNTSTLSALHEEGVLASYSEHTISFDPLNPNPTHPAKEPNTRVYNIRAISQITSADTWLEEWSDMVYNGDGDEVSNPSFPRSKLLQQISPFANVGAGGSRLLRKAGREGASPFSASLAVHDRDETRHAKPLRAKDRDTLRLVLNDELTLRS